MEVFEAIYGRRSVRRLKSDPVPEEALMRILDAARWAPSWANSQCWEFIVVEDEQLKRRLSETLTPRNPAREAVAGAPVVLAACARLGVAGFKAGQPVTSRGGWWYMFDVALAVQNLCLAAHALGFGTVIVGAFDHREAEEALRVPKGVEVVALIPLGYPAEQPKTPSRRGLEELVHHNLYGIPLKVKL